jgi:hypothetical protein
VPDTGDQRHQDMQSQSTNLDNQRTAKKLPINKIKKKRMDNNIIIANANECNIISHNINEFLIVNKFVPKNTDYKNPYHKKQSEIILTV